jgi:hypothetical protein
MSAATFLCDSILPEVDMRGLHGVTAVLLVIGTSAPLGAQVHTHDHTSPYADFTDRDIKALSVEEVEGLLGGAGLGMALAGELNRYPGPRHVLDMAPMLGLTPEQESSVRDIFREMEDRAVDLGRHVVGLERQLDEAFAAGTITETRLSELVAAIAETNAHLRVVHLRAHLQLRPILTEAQLELYQQARGYAG